MKPYSQLTEEQKIKARLRAKRSYEKNRDKKLAWQKTYAEEHKEQISKRKMSRYRNDPAFRAEVLRQGDIRHKKLANAAKQYVQQYKETHPCIDCGECDPIVLQFHHLKDKKYGISKMICGGGYNIEKIKAEIEKCVILCSNCHIRRHAKARSAN